MPFSRRKIGAIKRWKVLLNLPKKYPSFNGPTQKLNLILANFSRPSSSQLWNKWMWYCQLGKIKYRAAAGTETADISSLPLLWNRTEISQISDAKLCLIFSNQERKCIWCQYQCIECSLFRHHTIQHYKHLLETNMEQVENSIDIVALISLNLVCD